MKCFDALASEQEASPVPEFIDPRFRENKPKTLVFSHLKTSVLGLFSRKPGL
jgi:hypothetical protein